MESLRPAPELAELLAETYAPCRHFGTCPQAKWNPDEGHVPRGFLGATGDLTEVRLVMVFAEPGHPYHDDAYDATEGPDALLDQTIRATYRFMSEGRDPFHRNVRWFMGQVFNGLAFEEALRHVWLTEGRLCSVDQEIGGFSDPTCARNYLLRQLQLMPSASVVAFGVKAQKYLTRAGIQHIGAFALAPPGAYQRRARPSWDEAITKVRRKL